MMYYIRDMETGKIVDKAETLEEALEKLKERGSGILEIV